MIGRCLSLIPLLGPSLLRGHVALSMRKSVANTGLSSRMFSQTPSFSFGLTQRLCAKGETNNKNKSQTEDDEEDEEEEMIGEEVEGGIKKHSISLPLERIEVSHCRSSGPGGQNVNKVNTKVEVRFNVNTADWIPSEVKERLQDLFPNRINSEGEFIVNSSRHRTQKQNQDDAFVKMQEMIDSACTFPKPRKKTKVPQWAKEQRMKEKRMHSEKKERRRGSSDDF